MGGCVTFGSSAFFFGESKTATGTPTTRLMEALIEDLIEPCRDRPFLVCVHDFMQEARPERLLEVSKPLERDSVGFCEQLWTGESCWGFAEVVPLVRWANRRRIRLRRPHRELKQNLPISILDHLPFDWRAADRPYATWVAFSRRDLLGG